MTHADRISRQLEDNKSDIREGALVEAIYRGEEGTGRKERYTAIKVGGKLLMRRSDKKFICRLSDAAFVITKTLRRGFEGGK